ncbi:hypothetical protein BM449_13515 [Synechococcus sp. SynAce01]|nr:hypothetical protein BM449_13515 [Synechococcus sp. SynAce01]
MEMPGYDPASTTGAPTPALAPALAAAMLNLSARMVALQEEIRAMNAELAALGATLAQLGGVIEPAQAQEAGALATPSQWLARRNAERINTEVMRRSSIGVDADGDTDLDTEVDLMIDRLHALCDHQQGGT